MAKHSNWLAIFLLLSALLPASFSLSPPSGYLSDAIISNSQAGYASAILYERFLPVQQIRPLTGELTKEAIQEISLQFLSENKDSIGISPSSLRVSEIKQSKRPEVPTSGFFYAFFQQYYKDVPVYGSYVNFLFIDGKLASMRSNYYPKISLNTVPKITQKKAEGIAKKAVDSNKLDDEAIFSSQLYVLPKSEDGRDSKLVWIVELTSDSEADSFSVTIDAQSGRVLEKRSTVEHATIEGTVTGTVYDDWQPPYDQLPTSTVQPFKYQRIVVVDNANLAQDPSPGSATADANGYYSITYSDALYNTGRARLVSEFYPIYFGIQIPYLSDPNTRISFYDSGMLGYTVNHNYTITSPSTIHNWNWYEITPPYRVYNAEANTYYHVNKVRDYIANGIAPFDLVRLNEILTRVKIKSTYPSGGTCGAYWYASGASGATIHLKGNDNIQNNGCPNAALVSDAIYHESGHGVAQYALYNDGLNAGPIDPDDTTEGAAMEEAFADYLAATMNNDPHMGMMGRNISSDLFEWRYPINYFYGGSPYGNSLFISRSKWDLRQTFLNTYGNSPERDVNTNGIYRADAMLLQTYMDQPRNFSWFFDDLILVAASTTYGGDGTDIYSAPDREAICDSFNFKHSLLPALTPYEYCARKGTVMPTKAPQSGFIPYYSFYRGEVVWSNGTSFAPRTSADIYIVPHVDQRTEGSAIENPVLPFLTVTFDVYGAFNASLWAADRYGSFDIIVDTNRDGVYNSDVDSITTFTVLAPSIIPSYESGEPNWPFIEGQTVYGYFSNFPPNQQFNMVIVQDSNSWEDQATLIPIYSNQMFSADGTPFTSPIWEGAAQGTYDIVADLNQNGVYDENLDTITGLTTSAFTVMPSPPACIPFGNSCIPGGASCCAGLCNPAPECSVDSDCTNSFYNRCENRVCVCDQGARCPDRVAIEYTCGIGIAE